MIIVVENPRESTHFDASFNDSVSSYYRENVKQILLKALPNKLFFQEESSPTVIQKQLNHLNDSLPILRWHFPEKETGHVSIILICRHRLNACSFFYDMVSRWLIPNKRMNAEVFFSADFRLPELTNCPFIVSEIGFSVCNSSEMQQIKKNLSAIETEIRLGIVSNYHANRILEYKGLSQDGKTAMIQEKIGSLIQSRSEEFDRSIFRQMQHFLINCQEEFKDVRDYHHLSRIISILHTIRKVLKQKISAFADQRHLLIKFLKTKLQFPNKERFALGIMVGLNFLKKREIFEKAHLLRAIKDHIQDIRCVENSFFLDQNRENSIQTIYLEIEKINGKDFTLEEIKLLRRALPEHLKSYIEHLMHPVFMPRNEEEILKNIMVLSKQLKYSNDIPQVIVNFEEQKEEELVFTVIMLRVLNAKSRRMEAILHGDPSLQINIERVKKVGVIRKKYYKEASVFKMVVKKSFYYRTNLSVDLPRARQDVIHKTQELFGEIRDYNGGMINKQNELYQALKNSVGKQSLQNAFLLEKFFFSLYPVEFRSTLQLEPLKTLFSMLINSMKKWKQYKVKDLLFKKDSKALYVMIPIQNCLKSKYLKKRVEQLELSSYEYVFCQFDPLEVPFMGYIYFSDDPDKQKQFLKTVQQALDF